MCKTLDIKYVDLLCDMPVRWNSTDKMIKTALRMEKPIRAVLLNQEWDQSVRQKLTPSDDDWKCIKEMAIFFNIFRRPTVQAQAELYPTLHNIIPNYLHMLRQLNVQKAQDDKPLLKAAAKAAYKILSEYYKKALATRHSFVAIICDPRYKLSVLAFMFEAEGGAESVAYKKGKAHFEHVYSQYNRRAIGLAELERIRLENIAIDVREARSVSPEIEGEEDWRTNPLYGYMEYMATSQSSQASSMQSTTELERWLREPCLPADTTPQQLTTYMQSKIYDFPIITQIARDYMAIPATSAPSERVFSLAGNLITKKRTKISSENVRYVLCLRSWGILVDADDEEEIIIDGNWRIVDPPDL
jgi:hypothetical protein